MIQNIAADCAVENSRKTCLQCGALLEQPALMQFENMPASAQDIPRKAELQDDHGVSLSLCRCPACGLVQFSCNPVTYYREVIRAVGLSQTMRELRRGDYRLLLSKYGMTGKKVLECGCGRGEFLEVLREFPVRIYGMEADAQQANDAQKNLNAQPDEIKTGTRQHRRDDGKQAKAAESEPPKQSLDGETNSAKEGTPYQNIGPCTIYHAFPETADLKLPDAPFDCFLSFNFLEHQPDPRAMLRAMEQNLVPGGIGLITVPSFEYIIGEGRYYELIRDHIANYSMDALCRLCTACGFTVLEQGFIGIGDTLRVVVQKNRADENAKRIAAERTAKPVTAPAAKTVHSDEQHADAAKSSIPEMNIKPLLDNYKNMRAALSSYMEKLSQEKRRIAMWGASHQGFTIAATTALSSNVCYIIDSAPFKQGRYAPASHIPIVPPSHFFEDPVDVILIAAPGYRKEIEALIRKNYAAYPKLKVCDLIDLRER